MPALKRKCDEDTWMVTQSKKFKYGHLLSSVYASTLAKLRMGARNFFGASAQNEVEASTSTSPIAASRSSPCSSPPASPIILDLLSDSDAFPSGSPCPVASSNTRAGNLKPAEICFSCARKSDGWEKCYFCETITCHLNICQQCKDGFCSNCCITRYESVGETYVCYTCLS